MRLALTLALLVPIVVISAAVPSTAQDSADSAGAMVEQHFNAVYAEDYRLAESYFSSAFRRAFRGDVARLNGYYIARFEQIGRGFEIVETALLADTEVDAAIAVVEFGSGYPDAPVTATERIYYYLIRENVMAGDEGRGEDGRAWRIDIFDAFRFDSLADARRRPYLYTTEAWPEDESRELMSRQGLFRIQWALDAYYSDRHHYPLRLLGGDNRRDELISGDFINGAYPLCGFDDRPMRSVDFMEKSSGDFTYFGVDDDGDGECEDYWLLLHGKVPGHFYYIGRDTVYILGSSSGYSQLEMAEGFAHFWIHEENHELVTTGAVEPLEPRGSLVPVIAQPDRSPDAGEPVLPSEESAETTMLCVAYASLVWSDVIAGADSRHIALPDAEPDTEPALEQQPPPAAPEIIPLRVYTYGF